MLYVPESGDSLSVIWLDDSGLEGEVVEGVKLDGDGWDEGKLEGEGWLDDVPELGWRRGVTDSSGLPVRRSDAAVLQEIEGMEKDWAEKPT